jgi:predicted TPR repeat methyltransferase
VGAMLDDAGHAPSNSLDILDAGCGTGLCGPLVAPYARRLTGVDLSAGMLAQAQEKQLYDELLQTELTGYLRDHPNAFDVIVSADTLVSFGALKEVVAAAALALRNEGLLIFTLEHAVGESASDFRLQTNGRYIHARRYVERLLAGAGLTAEIAHAELRMESGVPVAGLVIRARKAMTTGQ